MCHFSHGQFAILTLLLLVLPWTLICTPLPSPSVVEKSSRFLDCCKTHSSYQLSCNIFHSSIEQHLHTDRQTLENLAFPVLCSIEGCNPVPRLWVIHGILLPSQTCLSFQNQKISGSSFNEIWTTHIFHLQTITPHQDAIIRPSFTLCNNCTPLQTLFLAIFSTW